MTKIKDKHQKEIDLAWKNSVTGGFLIDNMPKDTKSKDKQKIEKMDIYDYPVNYLPYLTYDSAGRPHLDPKKPFEHAVIDKINEIINYLNENNN